MLSPEKDLYAKEDIDPVELAFSRRPFRWTEVDSYEIPLSLHCLGERAFAGLVERTTPLETATVWATQSDEGMVTHVHVSLAFVHRPLARKSITCDEAEGLSIRLTS